MWLVFAMGAVGISRAQVSEIVLHDFTTPPRGANPFGGVIRDPAGNLYGTTSNGGTSGWGVVYKLDTMGRETVLYNFTDGADGSYPYGALARDPADNLYGTTSYGGEAGWGVVYKLDAAGNYTLLHSFTGGADGGNPYSGVILDSAGNLYGTTSAGGASFEGVVYKVDATGQETVLFSFKPGAGGTSPFAGVTLDSTGNLYGTTAYGGPANAGVVYMLDTTGNETVLYSFTGKADGSNPLSGVAADSAGNLYGTTAFGGPAGAGVLYKLDSAGSYTALYSFSGGAAGSEPYAGVILDQAGNIYGTTYLGGEGAVYKLDPTGDLTVLHTFTGGEDGGHPYSGVILDSAGALYGTTYSGGAAQAGVVYKLDPAGHLTVLHSFAATDGYELYSGVIGDSAGLFGTTTSGGKYGAGVVYALNTTGPDTVLYNFTGGADGGTPYAGVIRDEAGNLYGTTEVGGTGGAGVVYRLGAAGSLAVLYSFTGGGDGANPSSGVIRDAAGNLYGTTKLGGTGGAGVVYRLDMASQLTVLYSFTGGADGAYPGSVIRDPAGNIYGTAGGGAAGAGVVFKLDTTGHLTVLHTFNGRPDGADPSSLIRDSTGNLYGTTINGGAANEGVVFKLDATGHLSVLHTFGTDSDGSLPGGGLIRDAAGNLFGTTDSGGAANWGTVYKLDATGFETVL